ncbi:CDP-diacylglycerol--glycerol-3-phosphate 3-phosphatidyltransferase [uncultured Treponema sp.]|uniref:CDP-diacylglycerol--glycerol-3-phosphate 3-phosphatidyltransferase n=1 Tax=uncultured Treponema sp. TaxID=162155 RepID=UPI0025E0E0C1|nr:CDP-diacylglycerol--glycerol-3-phosphate 3-phosphatidyltransferase [uncultured Treponema sp.]
MKVSNRFTLVRALFAPVFYLIFNLPVWLNSHILGIISACIMIPLLAVVELTDYWDGHYARKNNEVSDFGKLFDPFADVILNLTVFICAVSAGYMPMILFVLILYRELSQSFLRTIALKKGVAIAARKGGKLKTVFYIISGFFFLTLESYTRFAFPFIPEVVDTIIKTALRWSTFSLFIVCVGLSWGSFADYIKSFYSLVKDSD